MVSVASGGTADRIAARILFKVLRAGSGTPQGIHQRFSERRCLSPQNCDCQISLFSCGQCYENFHFKSMPQTTVQPFDMTNAIASSDTLSLACIVVLPDI
jgi:hypothetical protein